MINKVYSNSIINIGEGDIGQITDYIGQIFSDLLPVILLIVGVLIAVFVIEALVNLIRGR